MLDARADTRRDVRVLLVDDDDGTRTIVRLTLAEVGVVVHAVRNANDAIDWLRGADAELVICNRWMPGSDGIDFVDRLRASTRFAGVPVIYLEKPFAGEALIEAIEELVTARVEAQ